MDCTEPEDPSIMQHSAANENVGSHDLLQDKTAADTEAATGAGSTGQTLTGGEPAKFLQLMALWLEGTGDPGAGEGEGSLSGWSARYAANFDRQDEAAPLDLAPVLGLPQGTPREELFRLAEEQEEDLIKQLIS